MNTILSLLVQIAPAWRRLSHSDRQALRTFIRNRLPPEVIEFFAFMAVGEEPRTIKVEVIKDD